MEKTLSTFRDSATSPDATTDIVVIGAGPVGLFAVFECGMLKMKCHVIDALGDIGGQCTALYPEKPIYDIPAHPVISGADLIAQLEQQAAPFTPVYHLGQQATGLEKTADGGWRVTTSAGTAIGCRAVIIAAGAGAFGPNRPPLQGIEAFENTSVFYMVRRREDFRGKRIVIAGGGDSAVDWAVSLAGVADKTYVVHRRDKFRATPDMVERMTSLAETGKIELVVPFQLHALEGAGGQITRVIVSDLDGQTRALDADCLLPFFGLTPQLGPIADWGLDVAHFHIPVDPATAATRQPGIFAIGDVASYPHKLKLILTGFAEAASAAHAAHALVFPGQALHFVYSTSKGVP